MAANTGAGLAQSTRVVNPDPDKIVPPKSANRFLSWFLKGELLEEILGDLEEYHEELLEKPKWKRKLFYWFHVLHFLRPFALKRLEGQTHLNNYGMFKNYFKMAVRSAKREKAFTVLNVFCLAVGFTVCLYAVLYANKELSFDHFHTKADRIYRINQTFIWGETDQLFGSTGPGVMNAVQSEIPEFETMCRVHPFEKGSLVRTVSDDNKTIFEENGIRAVDSTFFDVFSFELTQGNPQTALNNPYSIILTEEMALKYFGELDVIGRQLTIEEFSELQTYQITGVAANNPPNSHITFDMLVSMNSLTRLKWANDSWWWTTFVTFGVLRPDADPTFVAEKVAQVPGKYLGAFLMKYRGITYEEFLETGESWDLYIQPILDMHLRSQHVYSRLNTIGDIKTLYIMGSIAGLILLLSVINFVNLTTAKSTRRSREVGVRKVLGSNRRNLIWQFMFESFLFCMVALVVSLGLLGLCMDQFNAVSGREVFFESLFQPWLILSIIGFTAMVGIVAGLYPAFYLSSFKPVKVLKGKTIGAQGGLIRNSLVTVQFTISIALIACALIVRNQVEFWVDMDLGFNRDRVIVVQNAERLDESMETFKNELLNMASVENVSLGSDTPPYMWDGDDNFHIEGTEAQKHKANFWTSDENFADVFDLEFIAGRDMDEARDHSSVAVVTRALVERNGIIDPNDAVGKTLDYSGHKAKIVGVIEDFNAEFGFDTPPMVYYNNQVSFDYRRHREVAIKYRSGLSNEQIEQLQYDIEKKWQALKPGMPILSHFLNERWRQQFDADMQFGKMIEFYSILAMIIAGLGLTGLVAYVIERKTKEIGIRKVLGASVSSITVLLSSEFGKLLLVGFVLATGLSWYLMSIWVQDFDYQAPIPWYVFLIAGATMLVVAALTIGYQTLKSARANPVESLRDE